MYMMQTALRLSTMSKGRYARSAFSVSGDNAEGSKEWEERPGGMVVQLRDPNVEAALAGPMIRLRVVYGASVHDVYVKAHSSFGDLKKSLAQNIGLHPQQQRLLFKGKAKGDNVYLHEAGVKDKSKITLIEDIAGRERRLLELRKDEAFSKASKTIAETKQEVEKFAEQIVKLEALVRSAKKLPDDEFTGRIDLLMCQLLKLDGLKVEGDAKTQRIILMRKVQKYVEMLDVLRARNDLPKIQPNLKSMPKPTSNSNSINTGVVMPWDQWDAVLGENVRSSKSTPAVTSTTKWELFD